MTAVSRTAELVALYRALETAGPAPVVRDPFAHRFLSRRYAAADRARYLGATDVGYAFYRIAIAVTT